MQPVARPVEARKASQAGGGAGGGFDGCTGLPATICECRRIEPRRRAYAARLIARAAEPTMFIAASLPILLLLPAQLVLPLAAPPPVDLLALAEAERITRGLSQRQAHLSEPTLAAARNPRMRENR